MIYILREPKFIMIYPDLIKTFRRIVIVNFVIKWMQTVEDIIYIFL